MLRTSLSHQADGRIFLEFYIPRMGKRADAVLVATNIVFVIEFKAGASGHTSIAFDAPLFHAARLIAELFQVC
jgi:hypothetical protein